MNKRTLGIVIILAAIGTGAYYLMVTGSNNAPQPESGTAVRPTLAAPLPGLTITPGTSTNPMNTVGKYVAYSPAAFNLAKGTKRVLFFYASWCPTCKPADAEFRAKTDMIPADVTLFRIDYDTATDLKKQYNVTYQHTFVLVDGLGNEVTTWNGGGVDKLIANTQ